jgi:hypothetical protein
MGEPVSTFTGQREQQELKGWMSQVKVVRLPVIRTERSGIDLARQHLHAANRHNVVELRWVRLKRAFHQLERVLSGPPDSSPNGDYSGHSTQE